MRVHSETLKRGYPLLVVALAAAAPASAITITATFDDSPIWEEQITEARYAKMDALDAIREWQNFYCSPITVEIHFTTHLFTGKYWDAWGLTQSFVEDGSGRFPTKADVELNSYYLGKNAYYFDPTPENPKDDKAELEKETSIQYYDKAGNPTRKMKMIDVTSVLKHEVYHALGFGMSTEYNKNLQKKGGVGDKPYLDMNGNGKYDAPDHALADDAHLDEAVYGSKVSLTGYPGFQDGENARPTWFEVNTLAGIQGYRVHTPEPSTLILCGLGLALLSRAGRRRTPPVQ